MIYDELKRIFLKYEFLDELLASKLGAEQVKNAVIYGSFGKGWRARRATSTCLWWGI